MAHDDTQPQESHREEEDPDQVERRENDPLHEDSRSGPFSPDRVGHDRRSDDQGAEELQPDTALEGEIYEEVKRGANDGVGQALMEVFTHSGPLPPSSEFRAYEDILPGAADRIMSMAEESSSAAAEATKADAEATRAAAKSVLEDAATVKRGQYLFTFLALAFLITAVIFVLLGHPIAAILSGLAGVISGVGIVITPVNKDRWKPSFPPPSNTEN